MFGYLAPECPRCGAFYGDEDKHRRFHDSMMAVWQKAFGFTDEEAAAVLGGTVEQYRERMDALRAAGEQILRDRETQT